MLPITATYDKGDGTPAERVTIVAVRPDALGLVVVFIHQNCRLGAVYGVDHFTDCCVDSIDMLHYHEENVT
jgi:hypothetical protein